MPVESTYPPTRWGEPDRVGALDAGAIYRRLKWAIAEAESRGVRVPAGCRMLNALESLRQMDLANRPSALRTATISLPDVATASAHMRAGLEFFLIVYAATICSNPDHPFTTEKLAKVVRGPDASEGRDRSSRNTEFELYVAARFRLGGIDVFAGEPDFRYRFGSEILGVAAKRVTSPDLTQLKEALKDAVGQIQRTGLRGVIAVKLEKRLDGLPVSLDDEQMLDYVDTVYDAELALTNYYEWKPGIFGIISVSAIERALPKAAPNGLPVFDFASPFRFRRYYENLFARIEGVAFYTQWQENLAKHLRYCVTAWTPPLARE